MTKITTSAGEPLCWICGDPATTGEHKAKRSDLKAVFGTVSQSEPIVFNDGQQKNRRVGSLDSALVKWTNVLCAPCNNSRTQRHDKAWEEFAGELLKDVSLLVPAARIQLNVIFGDQEKRIMHGVHLYLAKSFGCLAAQVDKFAAKVDLPGLGQAIMHDRPHPWLYIAMGVPGRTSKGAIVSSSNPEMFLNPHDGSCALATWYYNVNGVCALVAYAPEMKGWAKAEGLWHPTFGQSVMTVKDFQGQ